MNSFSARIVSAICIVWLITSSYISSSFAQEFSDKEEAQAADISSALMSPFCPGRLLSDCPSASAAELKHKIKERLHAGESPDQIRESLLAIYGDQLRAAPSMQNFGLVAWLAPIVFLFGGGLLIFLWLRSNKPTGQTAVDSSVLDPELEAKVTEELNNHS
ncbi:MAG: cytochrome c-type biogenesis protein CcmH [Bdellovibrionales bacterium]|nr:cytochrome c-type biogenesis protein CcmH [Bdellovibrionales bacterium]